MKECFDYQASPRLDMTFNTYIKEKYNFFIFLFIIILYFQRELKPTKETFLFIKIKIKGKRKFEHINDKPKIL